MSAIYKAVVIGGGAAGLLCLNELLSGKGSLDSRRVLLLEKNDRVGKKLASTGNGRGNLFNSSMTERFYHGNKSFVSAYIKNYRELNPEGYFENIGIPLAEENGKIYPSSFQANSVVDILRARLSYLGAQISFGDEVLSVKKAGDKYVIRTNNNEYFSENVVFAFGGSAGRQFGTDGSAYSLVKSLGHTVTALYPSLVQLKTDTEYIKGLKGLKEDAKLTVTVNGKVLGESEGELLFTEYGVSGNAVFAVSPYAVSEKNAILRAEFLPNVSAEKISEILEYRCTLGYINYNDLFTGVINKRIGMAILKRTGADSLYDKKETRSVAINKIVKTLKDFKLKITGSLGFDYAQVTRGGVSTEEIEPDTYKSKINDGVYIVGEALDVDGDCGGYNLAFAFVSGIVAAKNIKTCAQA